MTRPFDGADPSLLDPEVWESPDRLSDLDLFAHTGPGWRRGEVAFDDPEDDQ